MEIPIPVIVAILAGGPTVAILQRFFARKKETIATELAVATVYSKVQEDLEGHIQWWRDRFEEQKVWFEDELQKERDDCDRMMKALGRRLESLEQKRGGGTTGKKQSSR